MDDLISRQAAIDLLKQMRKDGDMIPWEGKDVFARIRKLPPAQPDIIYCKDCGHRDDHGCCKYWKGLSMGEIPIATDDYDFCNHARRKEREH